MGNKYAEQTVYDVHHQFNGSG